MNLLKYITPLNLETEREKFLNSKVYNPIFKYYWQSEKTIFNSKGLKIDLLKSIERQDVNLIHKYAKLLFRLDDWLYVKKAVNILKEEPIVKIDKDLDNIRYQFEEAFKLFNLDEYQFKIVDQHGFFFRPKYHQKTIEMSKHAMFQYFSIKGEVRHELTHILRYENGLFNKISKSKDYLPTEEGLATYLQDKINSNNYSLYQHAAEYMASKIGMVSSLREIFDFFISLGFNSELAWHRASRHKFGFVDTFMPGDILKPAMYFSHSQEINKLNNTEIIKLFIRKISVKDLKKYDKYFGRFKLNTLIKFFEINN